MQSKEGLRLVVDTDCGVDDALAIILASIPDTKVTLEAVTCVQGNTTLENVVNNVRRVLGVCFPHPENVKVYSGCSRAIIEEPILAEYTHGHDGFGGVSSQYPALGSCQDEHAVNALCRLARQHCGELTLVTLGPLTNIALAERMDPGFLGRWKNIYIMGGSTNGSGNEYLAGEFNIGCDPEAAQIVIHESPKPVKIITIDVCRDLYVTWDFFDELTSCDTKKSRLIRDLYHKRYHQLKEAKPEGFHAYDLLAMAAAFMDCPELDVMREYGELPERCVTSQQFAVAIELHGKHARGGMFLERRRKQLWHRKDTNCDVVTDLDLPLLKHVFKRMITDA